ncbi:primase-like DNA-binding domain-containing protein [Xenorhabdus bovienii]|uniref:primase-like DNA-binding domain-containing protein n=1 Tax=Xenorhabdus bovienii TaxID=40576 RepID=UPI0023B28309|nr:primase-like DNA-binding domain-containing protein [Xenorhabdus bovienii]MDE9430973.1 toprim domain-containing protein [Xenorhabdus bovienii]MDE9440318.1 toprim domain-containing protein [Xenorhabdus bovienii]MDE9488617.1 toprim domain-containing protein [Xenorhabdus bovienii]MDE9504997.1 toprim domain-containing protein [Xenorhabdus bovienii]MDE9546097.1 toprim domain-containing protein [Xenorhabdus bovienii]
MNQGNNNQKSRPLDVIRAVKQFAITHWQLLLPACGVDVPLKGKHGACPICGGTDRFHFIDDNHNGDWHCRQCDEPNHGDGLDLVARTKGITIFAAAKLVADVLALPLPEPKSAKEQPRPVKPIAERITTMLATAITGESQYLVKKGLQCPNQRLLKDGSLLLVVQTLDGTITGGQTIKPNGEKRLVSGTQKKGSFIPVSEITGIPDTIIITEGYATALTVSQLHDGVVLAAIDESNLSTISERVRTQWPDAKIIIAADNDWHEPEERDKNGRLKKNVGKIAAEKTAKAINGWVTLPPTAFKADWDDYRQRHGIEAAKQVFNNGLYQVGEKIRMEAEAVVIQEAKPKKANYNLAQMAASQRGALVVERYGRIAVNPESDMVYHFNGTTWQTVSDNELRRAMVAIFDQHETPYSPNGINNAICAMKLQVPVIGEQRQDLIGFSNGVYELSTQQFTPHQPEHWLMNHNGITFTPPAIGENLPDHAPDFYRWLSHTAGSNENKMARIKAALFMILANRYDWQLFIEVTGEGGSGKSIFTYIATLLAGEHNTASGNMRALDEARGRYQFVGKSLITLPDQVKYVGEGAGIKAITGGDLIEVDGKYEKQFSTIIKAVVLATNNEPMSFTERNGGIARRRVIFPFNIPVKESEKDLQLPEKISRELPVIIRHLLTEFADQNKAKKLLQTQRDSNEALTVKSNSDPLYRFCGYLVSVNDATGMKMGNKNISPRAPRLYLYHAYLSFMEAHGFERPLTLTKFGESLPKIMLEYRKEYRKVRTNKGYSYNVELSGEAEEWLPSVPELRNS